MESDFESDSSLLSTPELRLDAGAFESAGIRFAALGPEATDDEDELRDDELAFAEDTRGAGWRRCYGAFPQDAALGLRLCTGFAHV